MTCGSHRATPSTAFHRLVGWVSPEGAAQVGSHGYPGLYPPQLVLEHLVPIEQRCVELVRAVYLESDQLKVDISSNLEHV